MSKLETVVIALIAVVWVGQGIHTLVVGRFRIKLRPHAEPREFSGDSARMIGGVMVAVGLLVGIAGLAR